MKTIVVASDSFKGSLTSAEVAGYVKTGVHRVFPDCNVRCVSIADGGEGTVDAVISNLNGQFIDVLTEDPLGRQIQARYGLADDNGEMLAVVEVSAASGLPLLSKEELNPMVTSTYGTGLLIRDALLRGCRKFFIGLGGSATNDAGTGLLSALGFRFLDAEGNVLPGVGASLDKIVAIDDSKVMSEALEADYQVACDVTAPFCGPDGAACVFAPQKGADTAMVENLDKGLKSFASVINKYSGIDLVHMSGAGAAGGLGGGFSAFLGASLVPGADMVLDAVHFDEIIEGCDLVITGEGKIDVQTAMGKAPTVVLQRASAKNIPVVAIGGRVDIPEDFGTMGFSAIFPVVPAPMPIEEAMRPDVTGANIIRTVSQMMSLIRLGASCR